MQIKVQSRNKNIDAHMTVYGRMIDIFFMIEKFMQQNLSKKISSRFVAISDADSLVPLIWLNEKLNTIKVKLLLK